MTTTHTTTLAGLIVRFIQVAMTAILTAMLLAALTLAHVGFPMWLGDTGWGSVTPVAGIFVPLIGISIVITSPFIVALAQRRITERSAHAVPWPGLISFSAGAATIALLWFSEFSLTFGWVVQELDSHWQGFPAGTWAAVGWTLYVGIPWFLAVAIPIDADDPPTHRSRAVIDGEEPEATAEQTTVSENAPTGGAEPEERPHSASGDSPDPDTASSQSETSTPMPSADDCQIRRVMKRAQLDWEIEQEMGFHMVGGMEQLKEQLTEDVILPLQHPERFERFGIPTPNVLFYGPPGTGKTYMARALAGELGMPFVKLPTSEILSRYVNASAEQIAGIFREAEAIAAEAGYAVLFLDELDAILKERADGHNQHAEDDKAVNEFLNHLSETSEQNVLVIGATNRFDKLDEAAIRHGRFDRKFEVGLPDAEARTGIYEAQLTQRPSYEPSRHQLDEIARWTDGLTAADIAAVVQQAARKAATANAERITHDHVEQAFGAFDPE